MKKNIGGGYVYNESDSSASYSDEGFSVESLNDVEVSNPETGQALVYDSSSDKWVNETVGDFDAIIHYSMPLDTSAPPEITIERGSYASLYQKLNSGQTPSFLITLYDPVLPLYYSTAAVYIYSFDSEVIYIIAKVPTLAEISSWPSIELLWNNDDTITMA